ncbi:hypothetical protein CWI36_1701p0010, partial [Hamiltosporidium magnivora]
INTSNTTNPNTTTINTPLNTNHNTTNINTPFIYQHNTINRHPSIFNEMPEFLRYNDIPQESNKTIKTVKSPVIKIDRQHMYSKEGVKYTEQEIKHNNEINSNNGSYSNNGYNSTVNNTSTTNPYSNTPLNNNTNTPYSNTPLNNTTTNPYSNTPLNNNTTNPYSNTPLNNTNTPYSNTPLNNRIERDIYNTNYRQNISQQQDTNTITSPRKRGRKSKLSPSLKKIQNISSYSENNLDSKDNGVSSSNSSVNMFDRIMGNHFDTTRGVNNKESSLKGVSSNYYTGNDLYGSNGYNSTINNTSTSQYSSTINNTSTSQYNNTPGTSQYNNTSLFTNGINNTPSTTPYNNTTTTNPYNNTSSTNPYTNTPSTNPYNNTPSSNPNLLNTSQYNNTPTNPYNNTSFNSTFISTKNKVVICKKVEEIKEEETWKLQEKNLSRSLTSQDKRVDNIETVTKKVELKVVELSRKEIIEKVLKEIEDLEEEYGGYKDYCGDNDGEDSEGEGEGILTPDDLMDRLIEERRVFFEEGIGIKMVKGFNIIEEGDNDIEDGLEGVSDKDNRGGDISSKEEGVSDREGVLESVSNTIDKLEGFGDKDMLEGVNNTIDYLEGVSNCTIIQHPFNNTTITLHSFNNTTITLHPFNNTTNTLHPFTNRIPILKSLEYKPNITSKNIEYEIKKEKELTPHEKYKLLTNKIEDGSVITSDTYFLSNKIFGFKIKLKKQQISDEESNKEIYLNTNQETCGEKCEDIRDIRDIRDIKDINYIKDIKDINYIKDINKTDINKTDTYKTDINNTDIKDDKIEDIHSKVEWLNAFVRKNKKDLSEEEKKEIILKINLNKNSLIKMENVRVQFINLCGKNEEYFKFLRVKCVLEKQAFCVKEEFYFLDDKTVRALFEYLKELNALLIKEIEKSSVKMCDKGEISFRKCVMSAVSKFEGGGEDGLNVLLLSKKR